jgi:N-acetylglucosaminyldiphosphoundecaprenol N-acetyl-beta-D-mannosaminyltransferase
VKYDIAGVLVDALDYDAAVDVVLDAARRRRPLALTALAVHGVVTASRDAELRHVVNHLDVVTPDGQPVRWALDLLHRAGLRDRVYGPTLSRLVVERAAVEHLGVFLYGSTAATLDRLRAALPDGVVVGSSPSRFRTVDDATLDAIASTIRSSGAAIVLVGLGCPRQERFVSAMRSRLDVPLLAIGAAFDYLAGMQREPPRWVQRAGLQWLWRLAAEPRRLWRRYLLLNPAFVALVAMQRLGRRRPTSGRAPAEGAAVPA